MNNTIKGVKNFYIEQEHKEHNFRDVFKNDSLIVGISKDGGLLGSNFIANLSKNGLHDTLGISLSPKIMFILTNDYSSDITLKYTGYAWKELTDKDVFYINMRIIKTGDSRQGGIIISDSKDYLSNLVNDFKERYFALCL